MIFRPELFQIFVNRWNNFLHVCCRGATCRKEVLSGQITGQNWFGSNTGQTGHYALTISNERLFSELGKIGGILSFQNGGKLLFRIGSNVIPSHVFKFWHFLTAFLWKKWNFWHNIYPAGFCQKSGAIPNRTFIFWNTSLRYIPNILLKSIKAEKLPLFSWRLVCDDNSENSMT